MKKALHLTLAGTLTVSLLSACGDTNTGAPGTAAENKPAEKLKFSMSMTTSGNKHAEKSADVNNEKWVKKLEELTNTDIDFRMIALKEFDQKMSLMFASNDIPDVVQNVGGATTKGMSGSVEAGVFMPLDDLLKQYAPTIMKSVPKEAWQETSFGGKIYGIPAWLSNPSRRATFIRADLLAKTGLPAPKTVDEFLEVMRAFKKLGVEHPYQMRENFKYADTILGAFDVLPSQFEIQNDQVVPKFFDVENMTKALQTFKTMFDEGLIPKDFATISSGDYGKNIEGGKAAMWSANAQGLSNFRNKIGASTPGAQVEIIPSPRGPENRGGHLLYSSINTSYYINSKVSKEKAIEIIKFFEWMTTPEAEIYFSFGIEGDTYTKENGAIKFTPPTATEALDEDGFRGMFWFVHDTVYNKAKEEMTQNGRDMIKYMDTVISKEGLGSVRFVPTLQAYSKYPDLTPLGDDVGPKLIIDHMTKMIYGKEPISDWPKVIEEYKNKGGNEILKEATERYKKGDGVIVSENRS
ncbi:putative aldouronate transport system substrate-binding protein [Paenibacillus sp. UNCCL117]|uniref:extracellular solute-binding protein n=1 Tax=unclassified Paenibacillus TaxID=185978 RepID=UPI00087F6D88|nr:MULTISPECIES: extracellular solute-binding protein [unclassified Paenibacillus]SDD59480.1 putative aldouronate transport system substrate-binding protein [Paenibacillus sp. cl123]SFW50810.1 putative aldouronate transport system substrate-binding protein [Paenibacillus sp. UNCCL117]